MKKKKMLFIWIPLALVLVLAVCWFVADRVFWSDGIHWWGDNFRIKLQGPCYIYNIQEDTFEESSTLTVDAYRKGGSSSGEVAVADYPLPEWEIADPQDPYSEYTFRNWSPYLLGDEPEDQVLLAEYYFTIYHYQGEKGEAGYDPVMYRLVQYRQESGTAVQITSYNEDGDCEELLVALYGFSSQEEARQFAIKYKDTLTDDPRPVNKRP